MKSKTEDVKDEKEPKTTEDTKQQSSGESDDGILVSEEFQKKAHGLLSNASKHEVRHVHDRANAREDELRKAESEKDSKRKPKEFTAESSY